jgi:hypothetical protein
VSTDHLTAYTSCRNPECASDTDCVHLGKACGNGRCLSYSCDKPSNPDPNRNCATATNLVGIPLTCADTYSICVPDTCGSDAMCPTGMICQNTKCVPNKFGHTVSSPDRGCDTDSMCPEGLACLKFLCAPWGCVSDQQCSNGQICRMGSCIDDIKCIDHSQPYKDTLPTQGEDVTCSGSDCAANGNSAVNHLFHVRNQSLVPIHIYTENFPGNPESDIEPGGSLTISSPGGTDIVSAIIRGQRCSNSTSPECQPEINAASLFETTIDNTGAHYDLSYVNGVTFSIKIEPLPGTYDADDTTCVDTGCRTHVEDCCPDELRVVQSDGTYVGCSSKGKALANDPLLRREAAMYGCNSTRTTRRCGVHPPCPSGSTLQPDGWCTSNAPCEDGVCPSGQTCVDGPVEPSPWGTAVNCIPSKWPTNYPVFFNGVCPTRNYYSFPFGDADASWTCKRRASNGNWIGFIITLMDSA